MTGQPEGTLSRRFNSWDGPSKVTLHRKRWMDKEGCCTYLEWLRLCYPEEKIGLICDAASSHFSDQVKKKASELNITLAGITPGCTSFIQICDLIANKPIKQALKKRYVSWKISSGAKKFLTEDCLESASEVDLDLFSAKRSVNQEGRSSYSVDFIMAMKSAHYKR